MKRFAGLKDLINERFPSRKASKLQDDEKLVTLQVGKTVWEQSPRQMRVELWMSSLQRRGVGVAAAAKFEDMLLTPVSDEAVNDIEKDIARTFPNTKRFAAAEGQEALRRVLHAYAAYDPEVGYCQGMNFVAGLLLMYLPERHAFGGLVVLMQDRGLRKYYSTDMSLLQTHLWQLGRLIPSRLCAHLESHGVLPLLYAASWLMTCFSADFPASFSARVMDVILHGWMMDQALLKAAVAVLTRCENRLLQMHEMEECLQLIKSDVPSWDEPMLHDVLTEAFSKPWTPQQLQLINSTEGAESVAEACKRVQQANMAAAAAAAAEAAVAEPPQPATATAAVSSREQRVSDGSNVGEPRVSESSTGCVTAASPSAACMLQVNGTNSSSKHGSSTDVPVGTPVSSAPVGIHVSVSSPAISAGGSSSSSSSAAAAVVVPQLAVPPSPKRPLAHSISSRPSSTAGMAGSSGGSVHHDLLGLGLESLSEANSDACKSPSNLSIHTGRASPSQTIEHGSFLIDLESPRADSGSATPDGAATAAEADMPKSAAPAGVKIEAASAATTASAAATTASVPHPEEAAAAPAAPSATPLMQHQADWDPFGHNSTPEAGIPTCSWGSFSGTGSSSSSNPPVDCISTAIHVSSATAQGSSSSSSSSNDNNATGSSMGPRVSNGAASPFQSAQQQQQQQPLPPQQRSPATVQGLRQQLEQLSFSQLSQQHGSRLEQHGARLELLEQLNRQQQVLQRHYSLPRGFSLQNQLPPTSKPPKPQQQQQSQQPASGVGDAAISRLMSEDWSDFQSPPVNK